MLVKNKKSTHNSVTNEQIDDNENNTPNNGNRRTFIKAGLASGAAITAVNAAPALADDFSAFDRDPSLNGRLRATKAAQIKVDSAVQHLTETAALPDQFDNDDETRYKNDNFYASFSKTLPSNNFGEVDPAAFKKLRKAMRKGRKSDFDAIPLDATAARRLENPQGALRFEVSALDSHATRIAPSFTFRGSAAAGEIGEVYWQALTREIPFIDYDSDASIAAAVSDLNSFQSTPGPVDLTGHLTADRLFRGETPGDLNGPYISQFMLRDVRYGPSTIKQMYREPTTDDFMVDLPNWLNIQRGGAPAEPETYTGDLKFIYNNRVLSEYVHRDALYQAYQYAALIILGLPGIDDFGASKFDAGNPYFNGSATNQTGFSSLGGAPDFRHGDSCS